MDGRYSGEVPGAAVRISGPPPAGHHVRFTEISPDGSVASYEVWPDNGTAAPVHEPWLVDLAAPEQRFRLADQGCGVIFFPN